jgi:hypothetical protein
MSTTITTPTTSNQKSELENFVAHWEKMGHAYFWTPPMSASGRRSYEEYQSRVLVAEIAGSIIQASISVSCSCKNIYVTRTLKVNGVQKRITALKNIIKSL